MACFIKAKAQNNAYLYIQGDKTIPFYVKVNGVMQPRYSKYYCIVPKLSAGETNVEILFQQNAYPAQSFTINIPPDGSKGFLLNKKGNDFVLYDLENQSQLTPIKK